MGKLNANRTAQSQLVVEFVFEFDDTMLDIAGALQDFAAAGAKAFDISGIPPDAVLMGGEVVTETAIGTSTVYNVSIGDAASATRYLGATAKLTAARTPLVPTGFVTTGQDLRMTLAITGVASAGKISVRAVFAVRGRGGEVVVY